jgi:hypothetical protein
MFGTGVEVDCAGPHEATSATPISINTVNNTLQIIWTSIYAIASDAAAFPSITPLYNPACIQAVVENAMGTIQTDSVPRGDCND